MLSILLSMSVVFLDLAMGSERQDLCGKCVWAPVSGQEILLDHPSLTLSLSWQMLIMLSWDWLMLKISVMKDL
jgi:hypothetical protein